MEPYEFDILETRRFLKRNFDGPEVVKALRFRLQTHLRNPDEDPLSSQVWSAYKRLPDLLKEPFSILDAGCMSGFLYHHLKRWFNDFTYTGVDRWPEALEVGRAFAPEVRFIQGDFMEAEFERFDYIVCSNIPFRAGEHDAAVKHLTRFGQLIMIYPNSEIKVFEAITPATGERDTKDAGTQKADIPD